MVWRYENAAYILSWRRREVIYARALLEGEERVAVVPGGEAIIRGELEDASVGRRERV